MQLHLTQGRDKDLDKLVFDKDSDVRRAVALQGRDEDLDKLVNDPNKNIRNSAADVVKYKDLENLEKLQKAGKIDKETDLNAIADNLPQWRESNGEEDREKLAYYGRDKDLDKLVSDPDWQVRQAVAYRGRGEDLDKLVGDPDYKVRMRVAAQGRDKDLDKLVNDKDLDVQEAVVYQGRDKDLNKIANDPKSDMFLKSLAEHIKEKKAMISQESETDVMAKRREAARRGLER